MSAWETMGKSDEWYTPKYIFDALACDFDLDVSAPIEGPRYVPAKSWHSLPNNSLEMNWYGRVWMNPPFGGRNGLVPWLDKFIKHGNGIALTPDRTSAPWWQYTANRTHAVLFISGKVQFERQDGTLGKSPSTGTTLFAIGDDCVDALHQANKYGLGCIFRRE